MNQNHQNEQQKQPMVDADATLHTRRRYDFIAPFYDLMEGAVERGYYQKWRGELWAEVRGPRVLELGVGTGRNIPYYPQNTEITAVDLSDKMLARARRLAAHQTEIQVDLRQMDAQQLAFEGGTFDEVVATFVFCSVPDPVLGLREARRVTRPGGRLLALEHMLSPNSLLSTAMQAIDPLVHWLIGVHIARRTIENVRMAGWVVDRVDPLSLGSIFRRIEAHNE
ncbi:MAG: methyltransferase domain-containing protein [Caldilineaceae bacterium]|nr:methyltransferase domain-containing protein [Caldilineaceae bacterium]